MSPLLFRWVSRLGTGVRGRCSKFLGSISQGGVEGDGDGVGEVEGADGGELDGDVALVVGVVVEDVVGEAVGFTAEEEVVAGLV